MFAHALSSQSGPNAAAVTASPPLALARPLSRFISAVRQADARAHADTPAEPDVERDARRRVVLSLLVRLQGSPGGETVAAFERILNGCLTLGYRARPLAAFAFEVLAPRFAARIRRRLLAAGQRAEADDVGDLVGATAETLARLIRDARRSEYTLRYALLLSIADHRTVDHLRQRRRRPEILLAHDDSTGEDTFDRLTCHSESAPDPERQMAERERDRLALWLRDAVFEAVNALPARERAALISVDLDGLGYPEVARNLCLSPTDVGNVVRRARLLRDRHLVPALRALPNVGGTLGFNSIQDDKELRIHMLRWSAEIGDGFCRDCAEHGRRLHARAQPCAAPVTAHH